MRHCLMEVSLDLSKVSLYSVLFQLELFVPVSARLELKYLLALVRC